MPNQTDKALAQILVFRTVTAYRGPSYKPSPQPLGIAASADFKILFR